MKKLLLAGFAAIALLGAAAPADAQFYHPWHRHWHYWHRCWNCGPVYYGYGYYPAGPYWHRPWGWHRRWRRW